LKIFLKRAAKWTASLAGVVCLLLLVVDLTMGSIVKFGIERFGSAYLGVPVTVRSVSVSPLVGRATLTGLRIGNPPGYLSPALLEVRRIEAGWDATSLWDSYYRVNRLRIESPKLYWEGTVSQSNLSRVQAHLKSKLADQGCSKKETKLAIGHLQLDGTEANVLFKGARRALHVTPADVEMDAIGTRAKGMPAPAIASKVLEKLATNTLKEALLRETVRSLGALLQ
jgi:hypothetical protein